jgi:predicted nucleic acid-binding protein
MRVLLDACILYPTVMREILLGVAKAGLFTPLWSARILEEWARAVAKNLPDQEVVARGEIALLRAGWPSSEFPQDQSLESQLHLPDPGDVHVLAAAITGKADILVTANLSDFPTRILSSHNILRRDPDGFLIDLCQDDPASVERVCEAVRIMAEAISGQQQDMRALLKKARLPRLGKALQSR